MLFSGCCVALSCKSLFPCQRFKGCVKGGLLLDTRVASRKGGDSGAAVVPKNVAESLLISALKHDGFEIRPKGKLPEEVIADFVKWVEMGAPDPRDGEPVPESKIDFEAARGLWAYQSVRKPERPVVSNGSWCRNELDYFTLAKMESLSLHPVASAEKRALIRRATTGLCKGGMNPRDELWGVVLARGRGFGGRFSDCRI